MLPVPFFFLVLRQNNRERRAMRETVFQQADSGCFFCCQCPQVRRLAGVLVEHPHFFPVVGEFLTAIKTNHIGASDGRCATPARVWTKSDRKTVIRMPTTKEGIQ